jgi:hypothetical protein
MKKPGHHRRIRPRPMDLRRETQQRLIATLLLLGWSVARIARKLGCTERAIRWRMDQEEFQRLFDTLQQEHFKTVHRKLGSLLNGAVDALERLLKHSDWKARDAALAHIFKISGKYIDNVNLTGTLDHTGQVRHVHAELVEGSMSDEMRDKARELLKLQRQMFQRQLPAKFNTADHDPSNGRFLPNGQSE